MRDLAYSEQRITDILGLAKLKILGEKIQSKKGPNDASGARQGKMPRSVLKVGIVIPHTEQTLASGGAQLSFSHKVLCPCVVWGTQFESMNSLHSNTSNLSHESPQETFLCCCNTSKPVP